MSTRYSACATTLHRGMCIDARPCSGLWHSISIFDNGTRAHRGPSCHFLPHRRPYQDATLSTPQAPVGFILKDAMREFTFDDRETAPISAVAEFSMAGVSFFCTASFSCCLDVG